MHLILAFPVYLQRPEFGSHAEDTAAMDLFVIINLAFLFLMLGFFGVCGWMIWRRTVRPEPHMRLIMELEEDDKPARQTPGTTQQEDAAAWERPADWWKS